MAQVVQDKDPLVNTVVTNVFFSEIRGQDTDVIILDCPSMPEELKVTRSR